MVEERRDTDGVSEQHKEAAQVADITAEAKRSAGQRAINGIWEITQAVIALGVTGATLYASVTLVLTGREAQGAFLLLSNAFFLVIGFYFGRTNHQRTGGVGINESGR